MLDYIIVGGGVGGVSSYAILERLKKKVMLFEQLDYLGGCAGTFKKNEFFYNVGATTLVGIDNNLPLGILLSMLDIKKENLPIKRIDPSIVVFLKDKIIKRFADFEESFEEINKNFYHKNNKKLWEEIYKTANSSFENLYKILPYNLKNPILTAKMLLNNAEFLSKNAFDYFTIAENKITKFVGNNKDYLQFLNSQTLITTQCYLNEVSFMFASMGLSYPNLDNYYVFKGMSNILEYIVKNNKNIMRKTKVLSISKIGSAFKVKTSVGDFYSKRVILNKTVWGYCDILDENLKNSYCEKAKNKYNQIWSCATLHFLVKDKENILANHHYQILHANNPYTNSSSFFVSLSDKEDMKNGYKSVTISTHSKIKNWENLSKQHYQEKKEKLKSFILNKLCEKIPEFKNATDVIVGTPTTFKRYTQRYKGSVGGIPLKMKYTLNYPVNKTPIKDLFLVGDTVFPGQGYLGVLVGVFNLMLTIEKDFTCLFEAAIK